MNSQTINSIVTSMSRVEYEGEIEVEDGHPVSEILLKAYHEKKTVSVDFGNGDTRSCIVKLLRGVVSGDPQKLSAVFHLESI